MCDHLSLFIHGFTETHLDALCHLPVAEGEETWNGRRLDQYGMPTEHRGTVDFWRDGIVTRGVLYDIPRLRGTAYVTPGAPVHGWELADAADAQGIEPRAGDAVLIRSGHGPYFAATGAQPSFGGTAGVHASCIEFLHDTEASMLVWDMQDAPNADQGIPNPRGLAVPLHVHHILHPVHGHAHPRQRRLRRARGRLRGRRPLGVPVRGRAARDPARHRFAGEPARHPLITAPAPLWVVGVRPVRVVRA